MRSWGKWDGKQWSNYNRNVWKRLDHLKSVVGLWFYSMKSNKTEWNWIKSNKAAFFISKIHYFRCDIAADYAHSLRLSYAGYGFWARKLGLMRLGGLQIQFQLSMLWLKTLFCSRILHHWRNILIHWLSLTHWYARTYSIIIIYIIY